MSKRKAESKTDASEEKKETVQPGESKKAKKDEVPAVSVANSVTDLLPPESDDNDKEKQEKQEKQKIWLVQRHYDQCNYEWEILTTLDYNKAKRKFDEAVASYAGDGATGDFESHDNGQMTWREEEGDKPQRFELKCLLLDEERGLEPSYEDYVE